VTSRAIECAELAFKLAKSFLKVPDEIYESNMPMKFVTKLLIVLVFISLASHLHAEKAARPNVLFIGLDDMNDWIGCLGGHPQAKTPNLDRLAASGVLFTNAYCPGAACNSSRSAFFTGQACHVSGLYSNRQRMREVMPDAEIIPHYFSRNGYWSAGSGKMLHYFIDALSWDEYFPDKETENPFPKTYRVAPRPVSLPRAGDWQYIETDWGPVNVNDDEYGGDYLVTKWFGDQMTKTHDKPFFLACGIYRPHEPWFVPKKYFDLFPLDKIQMPPGYKEGDLEDVPEAGQAIGRNRYLEHIKAHEQWRQGVQAYLACIAYADAMVGRILDDLDRSPYRDNTIVCLWGDNGFHLGEKEHWQKFTGWRQTARVPLIIRAPKNTPGLTNGTPVGARCLRPVNLIDLYRTLTDLCGLPEKPNISGRSLVPLLANPEAAWPYPSITHLDHPDSFAVSTEDWRYIHYRDGGEELYHLDTDRYEWTNLAKVSIDKLKEMRALAPAERHPLVTSTVPNPALEWIPADRADCPASKDTTNDVAMHFLNMSGMKVRLWSVDTNGQKQAIDELKPNGVKAVQTFTGHAWLVTDLQGKPLGHFIAGLESSRAEIEEPQAENPKTPLNNSSDKHETK
jgi:arylsulfatase A-like enzyme